MFEDDDTSSVNPETGEINRPLTEIYDDENDITLYVISPLHSVSDVLRFAFANVEYDVEEFLQLAEGVTLGR